MKLNPDCVRDVLLSVEKLHQVVRDEDGTVKEAPTNLASVCSDLPKYDKEDVYYTLKILSNGGLIEMDAKKASAGNVYFCRINGLTFRGHEFIQQIRDDNCWAKVKKGLDAVRNYSLDAMSAVAKGITSASIEAFVAANT